MEYENVYGKIIFQQTAVTATCWKKYRNSQKILSCKFSLIHIKDLTSTIK